MKGITLMAFAIFGAVGCSAAAPHEKSPDRDLVWFEYTHQVDSRGTEKTTLAVYPLDRAPVRDLARGPLFEYEKTVRSGITKVAATGVAERGKIPSVLKEHDLLCLKVCEKKRSATTSEIDGITQSPTWRSLPARRETKRDDVGRWLIQKLRPF